MRYLVIASCEDVRTGKEFEAGDEFLPEPDIDQALRLKTAGCLREIPDNAPALPGSNDSADVIADLRRALGENTSRAEGEVNALNARLEAVSADFEKLKATHQATLDDSAANMNRLNAMLADRDQLAEDNANLTARIAELEAAATAAQSGSDQQGSAPGSQSTTDTTPVKTKKA